ncbi:hypothetical protein D3C86_2180750 [compost metagenome]
MIGPADLVAAVADLAAVVFMAEAGSPAVVVFTEAEADFMAVVVAVSAAVDRKWCTENGSWHKRRGLC